MTAFSEIRDHVGCHNDSGDVARQRDKGSYLKNSLAKFHERDSPAHALPLARPKGKLDAALHVAAARRVAVAQLGEALRPEHVGV